MTTSRCLCSVLSLVFLTLGSLDRPEHELSPGEGSRHALLGCSGLLLGCGITAIGGWCYRLFTLGSSHLHVLGQICYVEPCGRGLQCRLTRGWHAVVWCALFRLIVLRYKVILYQVTIIRFKLPAHRGLILELITRCYQQSLKKSKSFWSIQVAILLWWK